MTAIGTVLALALLLPLVAEAEAPRLFAYGSSPGERVPDISATDLQGHPVRLRYLGGKNGGVVITRDEECPVSQRYMPRLRELAREFSAKGFELIVVDVTPHDAAAARRAAKGLRTILDSDKSVISALRAVSTAEAFVIDRAGTLRYRGAIDDQYGISHQKPKPGFTWLRDAVERLFRGEDPAVKLTEAAGCVLSIDRDTAGNPLPVTYHNRISRIIQSRCQECHRVGGLGPMPLESYREVFDRRAVIEYMIGQGRMPPWSASPAIGHWANDRSLPPKDKADLLAWIKADAPEGDPKDAPLPRHFSRQWAIGEPDATVEIPEPIRVPAQGIVEYKYVYSKTDFPEDKWVTAVEIRPSQPKVVHHVIVLLEEPGRKHPQDTAAGFFAITVPGSLGIVFPPGTGKKLPKGAWLKFEIHYQPNGEAVTDRTEIGFRFSPKPLREVESRSAANADFAIPPGNPHYEVKGTYEFKRSGQLLSLFPHMHLRGSAFRYDLQYPDGRKVALLDVPRFDFNWQSYYEFRKPLDVPAGAKLTATAWYDNSRENPWNPDAGKTVRWGPQTTDEMMIGYFDFIADRGS